MLHPWQYLLESIRAQGRTQKAFAAMIGKKVSELNELIKGKRNITPQRDILLCEIFWDAPKTWLYRQVDFDYDKEYAKRISIKQEQKREEIYEKLSDKEVLANEEDMTTTPITQEQEEEIEETASDRASEEDKAQKNSVSEDASTEDQKLLEVDQEHKKKREIFRNF